MEYMNSNGIPSIVVVTVVDTANDSWSGVDTPDHREVGVINAYCKPYASKKTDTESPDWVNYANTHT